MEAVRCEWVHRFLGPWQDGELDAAVAARIETHVDACSECAAHAKFERWFSSEIRRVTERPTAPERLADRISLALRREERNRKVRRVILSIGGLAAAAGLAVVLALGVRDTPHRAVSSSAGDRVASADAAGAGGGAPSSLPAPSASGLPPLGPADPDLLAADYIDRHERALGQNLPLELTSADADAVSSWFHGKVSFPVVAPRLPGPNIRLVGGRLTHVREEDAAYLRYDADARPVSVLVFRPGARPIGGERVYEIAGRQVFTGRRDSLNYAVFRVGDLAWALTSDLPESALLEIAGEMMQGAPPAVP